MTNNGSKNNSLGSNIKKDSDQNKDIPADFNTDDMINSLFGPTGSQVKENIDNQWKASSIDY